MTQDILDTNTIIINIKDLLKKVIESSQIDKYQYIIKIYELLAVNKKFVKDNNKFYLTMKTKAKELVNDIITKINSNDIHSNESQIGAKTIFVIISSINKLKFD